jgi:hypothetical protein
MLGVYTYHMITYDLCRRVLIHRPHWIENNFRNVSTRLAPVIRHRPLTTEAYGGSVDWAQSVPSACATLCYELSHALA